MNRFFKINYLLLLFLFVLASPNSAKASDDVAALFVKTLGYVRGLNVDNDKILRIGVVYDDGNPQSKIDAQGMKVALSSITDSGGIPFVLDLFPASSLGSKADFQAMIVLKDMESHYDSIRDMAVQNEVFVMGNDPNCARLDCCVVAIEKKAGTKIYLNESTMENTGFDMDTTFRYLAIRL